MTKRTTTVYVDSELVDLARSQKINLSAVFTEALRHMVQLENHTTDIAAERKMVDAKIREHEDEVAKLRVKRAMLDRKKDMARLEKERKLVEEAGGHV